MPYLKGGRCEAILKFWYFWVFFLGYNNVILVCLLSYWNHLLCIYISYNYVPLPSDFLEISQL